MIIINNITNNILKKIFTYKIYIYIYIQKKNNLPFNFGTTVAESIQSL